SEQGHYTLLTNIKSSNTRDAELREKLKHLEDVYSTFFYWFALKGRPRDLPDRRLVVVVIDTPPNNTKEFDSKHSVFDYLPMVGTGFTLGGENVVVVASRRSDEAFGTLESNNQILWENNKTNRDELLFSITQLAKQPRFAQMTRDLPIMQTL